MRTRWSAWLVFSVFTAGLIPGCPAAAHPPSSYPYSISVEDEYGAPLRTYDHDGQRFVLGSYGQRYTLVLRNHSGRRVEAVVSVDGRDVVSGRVADFARERGYVLAPYQTLRVEGFRKSYSEVAAFRFSTPEGSYSARMATPENVGVIGAAFFPERVRPKPRPIAVPEPQYGHRREYDGAAPASAAEARRADKSSAPRPTAEGESSARGASADMYTSQPAAPSVNNLGTEYGETRESHVEEVRFVRASPDKPASVSLLRYDNAAGLAARGIELTPRRYSYREPEAFPRNRFAPPPP